MNPLLRNILAVIAGAIIGGGINLALINLGPIVFPPPEGLDITTPEGLKEFMAVAQPKNFIFPFLGHALGTLVGAFIAAKFGATRRMQLGIVIGFFFLFGGIQMIRMVGGPMWFKVMDLALAYLPMGWLGGKMGSGSSNEGDF